jgi:hypothetical protein
VDSQSVPEHERVWNVVWLRRVVYFATVLVSLFVALAPLINQYPLNTWMTPTCPIWPVWVEKVAGRWSTWWTGMNCCIWPPGWAENVAGWWTTTICRRWTTLLSLAESVAPGWATSLWIEPAKAMPGFILPSAALIAYLLLYSGYLERSAGNMMREIWMKSLGQGPGHSWPAPKVADCRWIYRLRDCLRYIEFFAALRTCIFPTLFALGPVLLLVAYGIRYLLRSKPACASIFPILLGVGAVWFIVVVILVSRASGRDR